MADESVTFGKPKSTTRYGIRIDITGAAPVSSDARDAAPFTPTTLLVEYNRTGSRPWRFSRAVLSNGEVGGFRGCSTWWGHQPKRMAHAPQWLMDFIAANTPAGAR